MFSFINSSLITLAVPTLSNFVGMLSMDSLNYTEDKLVNYCVKVEEIGSNY